MTANLAVAMARQGLSVGVVDADIYGFSLPRMLGADRPPTQVDDMLLPPESNGVKVVSIGQFVAPGQPVVWRGPMLHRALQQFLAGEAFVFQPLVEVEVGHAAFGLGDAFHGIAVDANELCERLFGEAMLENRANVL